MSNLKAGGFLGMEPTPPPVTTSPDTKNPLPVFLVLPGLPELPLRLNTASHPPCQGKQTHPAQVRITTCPGACSMVYIKAPLVAQTVKNPPAMQETWVGSLGPEDNLEKGMATHSSILAWEIPRTEEPGRLQSLGSRG